MARRQMNIPGTERTNIPEIEKLSEEFRDLDAEFAEKSAELANGLGKRRTEKKHELIAMMRLKKITLHRYDDEHGDEIEIELDESPKIKVRKTGEAEPEVGYGVESPDRDAREQGLINQALAAQQDAGVSEDDEGNVIPIDTAKPKAKAKKKGKAK